MDDGRAWQRPRREGLAAPVLDRASGARCFCDLLVSFSGPIPLPCPLSLSMCPRLPALCFLSVLSRPVGWRDVVVVVVVSSSCRPTAWARSSTTPGRKRENTTSTPAENERLRYEVLPDSQTLGEVDLGVVVVVVVVVVPWRVTVRVPAVFGTWTVLVSYY